MVNAPEITKIEFAKFQQLIHRIAGISLSDSKQVLLVGRLGRRLRHHNLASYSEYYDMVASGDHPEELQLMVDLLTTNETYFFREEKHFEFLAKTIVPHHPKGQPLDVWSAASSTGEEIYTIAMVLADTLGIHASWMVTGTDISQSVLEVAKRGAYWLDRTRGLSPEYLRKYCLKGTHENAGSFIISPELRRHTRFMQVNLNNALPEIGRYHVIFLRNVMIYFDTDTKRKVIERIVRKLHPGGYLMVGHSESLMGITDRLKQIKPTVYQME